MAPKRKRVRVRMPLDPAMIAVKVESYALPAGVSLQAVACLMNGGNRYSLFQIAIGLAGVCLMILGIDRLAG
jgi:hypothetical protein